MFCQSKWNHLEQRSQVAARKSPTSPELRSKWRVRTGGWHHPRPCQHSSSQNSLTQLPLITSLYTKFTALYFLPLALTMGFDLKLKKRKKNEAQTGTLWAHVENWLPSRSACSWGLQNKPESAEYAQSIPCRRLSNTDCGLFTCYYCYTAWPGVNTSLKHLYCWHA